MAIHPLRQRVIALLEAAGLEADGPGECDPRIHDDRFYGRVVRQGSLGLGESYMDGWWTVPSLDGMLHRLLRNGIYPTATVDSASSAMKGARVTWWVPVEAITATSGDLGYTYGPYVVLTKLGLVNTYWSLILWMNFCH